MHSDPEIACWPPNLQLYPHRTFNQYDVFQVMITDPGTGIDNEPPLPIYDITLTELDIAGGPNPQLR